MRWKVRIVFLNAGTIDEKPRVKQVPYIPVKLSRILDREWGLGFNNVWSPRFIDVERHSQWSRRKR